MKQETSSSIFPEFSWQRCTTFQKMSICAAEVIASPGWGGLCGGPGQRGGRNLADPKHSKMCSSFEPGSQGPRVMKRRSSGGQECIMWGNWPSGKCWGCVGFGDLITRVEEKLQPPSLRPSRARKAKHILLQPGEFIVRTRGPWQ